MPFREDQGSDRTSSGPAADPNGDPDDLLAARH